MMQERQIEKSGFAPLLKLRMSSSTLFHLDRDDVFRPLARCDPFALRFDVYREGAGLDAIERAERRRGRRATTEVACMETDRFLRRDRPDLLEADRSLHCQREVRVWWGNEHILARPYEVAGMKSVRVEDRDPTARPDVNQRHIRVPVHAKLEADRVSDAIGRLVGQNLYTELL